MAEQIELELSVDQTLHLLRAQQVAVGLHFGEQRLIRGLNIDHHGVHGKQHDKDRRQGDRHHRDTLDAKGDAEPQRP